MLHLITNLSSNLSNTTTMTSQVYDIINICDNGAAGTAPLSNKHDYSKQVTSYLPDDDKPQQTSPTKRQILQTNTNEDEFCTPEHTKITQRDHNPSRKWSKTRLVKKNEHQKQRDENINENQLPDGGGRVI